MPEQVTLTPVDKIRERIAIVTSQRDKARAEFDLVDMKYQTEIETLTSTLALLTDAAPAAVPTRARKGTVVPAVLAAMERSGQPSTLDEIVAASGQNRSSVRNALMELAKSRKVEQQAASGRYALATVEQQAAE